MITAAVMILALAAAAWGVAGAKSKSGGYLIGKAAYGDIVTTVSANATVEATRETTLSFKNSGYVEDVYVQTGQFVRAGTVLAKEQASNYQAQLDEAEAGLESARANYAKVPDEVNQAWAQLAQAKNNLNLAESTLGWDEALYQAGAIAKSTLDTDRNTYRNVLSQYQSAQSSLNIAENTDATTALAAVKAAQAQVAVARNNLSGSEIVATMDGYVVNINGNAGQYTEGGAPSSSSSSTSSSQFTITVSSNKLQLLAEINEADIARVGTRDRVTFTVDAFSGRTYTGTITSLAAEATQVESVECFAAYVSIDDQTGLKAGMPATLDIISSRRSHVLVVPRTALDYGATVAGDRSGNYVVVISDGRQRLTPVRTGLTTETEAEITGGLADGQAVVLGSQLAATGSASSSKQQNQGGALGGVLSGGPPPDGH